MIRKRAGYALVCCLLMLAGDLCTNGYAKPQEQQVGETPPMLPTETKSRHLGVSAPTKQTDDAYEAVIENPNALGVPFLKNLVSDQKAIWTSPAHLRWADGAWLFPLAAATAGFLATDRAVPPALSTDPNKLNRYTK